MGLSSGVAVRRLAEKQNPETVDALERLVDELRCSNPGDREHTFELVRRIMTLEHRARGSRRLRAELRSYAGFLPQAFRIISGRSHDATVDARSLVLRAIVAGDGDSAARYPLEDFRDAGMRVVGELECRGVHSQPTS
jgi:DNA-binding GntR family transcriptional regulator